MKHTIKHPDMILWCISHFLIDFVCTALLSARIAYDPQNAGAVVAAAIIYNGLAFAFQFPIGAVADLTDSRGRLAAVGCLCVALGVFIHAVPVLVIVIGLGNAMFHIGAGRHTLLSGGSKARRIGFFVAPGAVGIFFGPRLCNIGALQWTGAVLLVISALLGVVVSCDKKEIPSLPVRRSMGMLSAVFMFLTVLMRSYIGTVLKYDFMSVFLTAFIFTVCIFLGKFTGGIWTDRFGAFRFHAFAQPVGVVLMILSLYFPPLGFAAILLFNTTMATTASLLYRLFPGYPATTFGLTTLALYIGVLPKLLNIAPVSPTPIRLGILGILSTLFLLLGIRCAGKTS